MKISRRSLLAGAGAAALAGCRKPEKAGDPIAEAASKLTLSPTLPPRDFHAGMSLAHVHHGDKGYGSEPCLVTLKRLVDMGVTHVSVTPFGYQPSLKGTEIRFGATMDRTMPDDSLIALSAQARSVGLKVLLKPHIWSDDFWRGKASRQDIDPGSDEGWQQWFERYTAFAVHYARVAASMDASTYCVGLEYLAATKQNPGAWADVAAACRAAYAGELTYAANWWGEIDGFKDWAAYDAIGVNAYPPLSESAEPTTEELIAGWDAHLDQLDAIRSRYKLPVLLTEAGLPALKGAAARPWDQGQDGAADPDLQARAYEALLHTASTRDWVKGIYFWKVLTNGGSGDPYIPAPETERILHRWWSKA